MSFFEQTSSSVVKSMVRAFWKFLERLNISSFGYLNATQFLGAMNDNIFKLLIAYCFIQVEGIKASNTILAAVGAIYVVPFLLFSQSAGMMADRYSKRTIIVATKVIEIFVMLIGMLAFGFVSKVLAFTGLFLLACHSAIFGPCKYGIVPEIVPQENISKANGLLTSCTYIAIIIGTFLASFLTELTGRHFVISAAICSFFSFVGLITSLMIQQTAPAGSQKKVTPWFIAEFYRSMKTIRKEPSLLTAVIGSAYFLFVGSFVQLNMIPFAIHTLHLSDIQGGYLFLLTALGIGGGSLLAGKLSGRAVELGLVPIGGIGMTICLFLLDYLSPHLYCVIPLVILVGGFGGLYLVPLDSYIQIASPKTFRGQVVAATNFLGFFGVLCSAGVLYLLSVVLELQPDHGFTIMGLATIGMITFITISMSGYVVRFFGFLVSRILFRLKLHGAEEIPLDRPSVFFVPHSYWPWAMALLAAQRRRMRLFTLHADQAPSWLAKLAKRFLPVLEVNSLDALCPHGEQGELILHSLQRGTSVGIFCSQDYLEHISPTVSNAWHDIGNLSQASSLLGEPRPQAYDQTMSSTFASLGLSGRLHLEKTDNSNTQKKDQDITPFQLMKIWKEEFKQVNLPFFSLTSPQKRSFPPRFKRVVLRADIVKLG
jgi:acyl-[acyl-carrier-protein]-phospholipid O-acyltransferase / long-chain-fatty-acid--[acyl-carrier-protein] ligase